MADLNLMNELPAEADMAAMEVTYEARGAMAQGSIPAPPPSVTTALQEYGSWTYT